MKTKTTILLLLLCSFSYGQKLKKITNSLSPYSTESYQVLKKDKNIKYGAYELKEAKKLMVKGSYKNNQKSGYWHYYFPSGAIKAEGAFLEGNRNWLMEILQYSQGINSILQFC